MLYKYSYLLTYLTGHHFRTIQTIAENVHVWLIGLRHPVSERQGRRLEIFLLTYLLAVPRLTRSSTLCRIVK